jgi:molybdate transport system substrate-binding protein
MRTLAIVIALLAATGAAQAAEINAFISTAIKAATDELLPPFERANGHTIRASYAPSGALITRFSRGEPVDVFVTDSAAIDELIKQGKIVAGRTDLARTSAPNPKFAHTVRQIRSRTLGSKGALEL